MPGEPRRSRPRGTKRCTFSAAPLRPACVSLIVRSALRPRSPPQAPIDAAGAIPLDLPLVFYYGNVTVDNPELYKHLVGLAHRQNLPIATP